MQPFKLVIKSPVIVVDPLELYWRQIGGHLRRVETCNAGVTWGIGKVSLEGLKYVKCYKNIFLGYDHTAWVYTGGWGGGHQSTLDSYNVHPMTDSQDYRIYENQRWNPVTGYTASGMFTSKITD